MTASQVTRQPAQYTQTGSMDCTSIEETPQRPVRCRRRKRRLPTMVTKYGLSIISAASSADTPESSSAAAIVSFGAGRARLHQFDGNRKALQWLATAVAATLMLLEIINAGMPQIPFVGFAKVLLQPTDHSLRGAQIFVTRRNTPATHKIALCALHSNGREHANHPIAFRMLRPKGSHMLDP